MKNNLKFKIIVSLVILAGGLVVFWARSGSDASALDGFVQCLAERDIVMYGADWCPHCKKEKKAFGSSFQYVPYVECPDEPQLCNEKGIKGYPTWIFPDGKRLEGRQGIEKLSEESGCPLPQETR
jgi:glutaredoxin